MAQDYSNKPKATAIDDRERTPLDLSYHENIKGKVKCVCQACGLQFWAQKKRKTCSVECMRRLP